MIDADRKKPNQLEERIRQLERENKRLQRAAKRYETQLQQLDKIARANEKINVKLYSELEVLSKQAEAQAREAQIEAALERVRARAMSMHQSDDVASATVVLFDELMGLGVTSVRCGVAIPLDSKTLEFWAAASNEAGKSVRVVGRDSLELHPVLQNAYDAWKARKTFYTYSLEGSDLTKYYRAVFPTMPISEWQEQMRSAEGGREVFSTFRFSDGWIYIFTSEPLNNESIHILQRFAQVFDLTYRRHLDLQEAEARAREAVREASVDRVRAEIASMRTADDLQRITPIIWRELTTLGVPFFRCGVFIIDEAAEHAQVYLSTPSGESVAALRLKFDSTPLVEQTVRHWRRGEVYREEWDQQQFIEWTQTILSQGLIDSPEQYQAGGEAPEKLVLQLVPFKQGMLYVGSTSPLSDVEIDIVRSLADAFAVAYARYEDFQRLEAAKAEVETAFKELDALSKELEAKNAALESENQRKARELEEARRLQLSMVPKTIPSHPYLEIAAYMKTATEVGGDYYDFHVSEDGTLTTVVGDATGHGLKAGTMVTVAKSLFSSLAEEPDIVSTFTAMSTSIKAMKLPLLSMCLAMLKIREGKMKLSSAGIPPALIYRSSSNTIEEVVISGMPLGAMTGFPYREKEVGLEPGDTILLMSDGFPERMNDKEQMFDYARAQSVFKKVAARGAQEIIDHLVKSCDAWANGRPQDDDVTFVVIKCTPR